MGIIYKYLSAFWAHWWAIVAAGAYFGFDEFLQKWFPEMTPRFNAIMRPYRRPLRVIFLICAVFYAGYAAWEDEYKLRIQAEQGRLKAEAERDVALRQLTEKLAQEQKHIASVPFGSPSVHSMKQLGADKKKALTTLAAANRNRIGRLYFARYVHPDTIMYTEEVLDALKRSGLEIVQDLVSPDEPTQTGIMVACDDPENLPDSAFAIIEIFSKVDIEITKTKMLTQAKIKGATGCILFIGPDPL